MPAIFQINRNESPVDSTEVVQNAAALFDERERISAPSHGTFFAKMKLNCAPRTSPLVVFHFPALEIQTFLFAFCIRRPREYKLKDESLIIFYLIIFV